jgi:hypothetical protein
MKPRHLTWAAALLALPSCQTPPSARCPAPTPAVQVRPAPRLQFRGAKSPDPTAPADSDCNNPAHWDGDTLYVFNSAGHPWRSAGADLYHLTTDYRRCQYNNEVNGGRWIECTWKAQEGLLYGWYHLEPGGLCPGSHPESPKLSLTAPRIGAVKSADNGATWEDLGIVLEAGPELRCDTRNYYFAGGNGDFSIMLDARKEYLYFFFSTYAGEVSAQGVAVARMRWADRNQPAGKAWKWHNDQWTEPGLGGRASIVFPALVDWHAANADAYWGPSIHWNTYLRQYVILLNRAKDSHWTQEGIYVSFNPDLSRPGEWSAPRKILETPGNDRWYPQVMGLDKAKKETDKVAGKVARLFVRGESRWEIVFVRPGAGAGE